jgi:hypothetical protein
MALPLLLLRLAHQLLAAQVATQPGRLTRRRRHVPLVGPVVVTASRRATAAVATLGGSPTTSAGAAAVVAPL